MFSAIATVAMLLAGWAKRMNFLAWLPLGLLILYCLIGNAFFWSASAAGFQISELVFSFLSRETIYRTDFVMGLGSFCFGIGMISGYQRIRYRESNAGSFDPQMRRALRRFGWVASALCVVIAGAWIHFRDGGNVESVRLSIITAGFWPFIVAFFGWVVPFIGVYIGLKFSGVKSAREIGANAPILIALLALLLSVVIGFRTYFILIFVVVLAAYATRKHIEFRFLLITAVLSVGAFLIVTYIRVEGGDGEDILISVFKRISLETVGAANIVFRLVDSQGFFFGSTLLMDIASKLPGRQETFGGMLGAEAGFDEGLTLTPSGVLEMYANFGPVGYVFLFVLGYFISRRISKVGRRDYRSTCQQVVFFLFGLDFIMGGSAAFFDLFVRMFLLNSFTRVRI